MGEEKQKRGLGRKATREEIGKLRDVSRDQYLGSERARASWHLLEIRLAKRARPT